MTKQAAMQSLEQRRAAFAWEQVKGGVDKEYVSLANGAPALIMSNGLMQALAYYYNRGGKAKDLADALLEWLDERGLVKEASFNMAMPGMAEMSSSKFICATEEALAFLKWLRQFAKANESK
jgi:CRISPR type III-B/RAMP module-associated protein Cmr5